MARNKKSPITVENLEIKTIAAEGKCVSYLPDERVVFVPFVAPGDKVNIQLTKRRKAYAEGRLLSIVEPSPHRIPAPCPHFTVCGGCKWQHIPYQMQLSAKEQQVNDQLQRIGKIEIKDARPIVGSEKIYQYRNKLEYTFSNRRWLTNEEIGTIDDIHQREGLGFHIPGMFDKVLDIKTCLLQDNISDRIRLFVKDFCHSHDGYPFFDLREQTGFMRTLMIRNTTIGGLMVVVVFAHEDEAKREALLSALKKQFPEITSLMYVINEKRNDTFGDLDVHLYSGEDHIWEEMEGLRFKIGPKSFYQTNSEQAYRLYSLTRQLADLTGEELVYDLYTGTGTIASFVSRKARQVIGIEYVPEAIEDARINAEVNGIANTLFYAGDMKDILTDDFVNQHGRPDVIITDPPRAGMHDDVVDVILRAAPRRIVYVSCNPASQARDVAKMLHAYDVEVSQPVDMFPHTHHVENILLMTHKER
ncbi:23S rRNA (uracil(1939)-C(5))-methyltransferase RlmD [Porphyromonas sp.]|uniref:23S rRNA (uracil(1939)-C(5))-methyltransferase RlmD n=1 Tax=Porphyromonas sp. TaxID=1924944 RepID=UPI0026DB5F47|nr:23S rRNA (uracil(1939)-C(5))-methyltransferase RlmD [Porphyromonas sp.]MDO4695619.1 23S rRNA (uracil(1939)-C(5))-methyltransferase RlmD [Porphyromonas sp.]MDO4770507.1 23S rRNA (uracil(1939)-C(5))-methyltransferase RlmD [Porphyromonas sp.]